ncbi:MAG: GNAT family N-acetyltransferase [Anaerolineae bacterium]|nr:GNAT family N-acetyltransferase [Anaerolineae bacterium]
MKPIQNAVTIRNAQPDEMNAILDLTLAAYAEFATSMPAVNWRTLKPAIIKTLRQPGKAEVIVAELDTELVGSVLLFPPESDVYESQVAETSHPELRLLAVKPSARGRGIGSMLMEECILRARRAGATALGLHTGDSMAVALPMYERRGFVRIPALDFDVEGGELVKAYRLDLTTG